MDQIPDLSALTTEGILSGILLMAAVVILRWFTTTGWADIQAMRKERMALEGRRQDAEIDLAGRRAEADIATQRQLAAGYEALNRNLVDHYTELRAITTIATAHSDILLHILERINGKTVGEVIKSSTEEHDFNR